MKAAGRRYLVIVQLGDNRISTERIQEAGPGLRAVLEKLSDDEGQLAFSSHDGSTFGFLVRSGLDPHDVRAKIEDQADLRNDDSLLVLETGSRFSSTGFSLAAAWLQHH